MANPDRLVLLANARLPSARAQSLQVVQMAAAFARVGGGEVTLLHAARRPTPALPPGETLFEHYQAGPPPHPRVRAIEHHDWIDRGPHFAQPLTARLQEWSFSRRAAALVEREFAGAVVLSREIEAARELLRGGRVRDVFLELHRVPGGRLRQRWLREVASRARGIVAISGGVRDDLKALGIALDAVIVEHDGFAAERFAAAPSRAAARRSLGFTAEEPLVVYTGGLLEWKGVAVLIDAARLLPAVSFAIVGGSADDLERLRPGAAGAQNVRLMGFRPPAEVVTYLAAADVGVVPNRSQPAISARYTSPLKVFEAMAVGLPLVVSDLSSLREILAAESEAFFVRPDDAAALAEGLRRALAAVEERARMSERLRQRAPRHTWEARAARILEFVAARRGGQRG